MNDYTMRISVDKSLYTISENGSIDFIKPLEVLFPKRRAEDKDPGKYEVIVIYEFQGGSNE